MLVVLVLMLAPLAHQMAAVQVVVVLVRLVRLLLQQPLPMAVLDFNLVLQVPLFITLVVEQAVLTMAVV
jgi:hypothetical protein